MKPMLMIRHQITLTLAAIIVLAMLVIWAVVEVKVKPDLINERQHQLTLSQASLSELFSARLEKIQLLASTLALEGSSLPRDEALFKQVFPAVIDNHGDKSIAGGGIWPEPNGFTQGVERRSFFWGRSASGMDYLDDYNDPKGSGYHNESWYQVGKSGKANHCSWSDAYVDPFTKTPMITCTVPMQKDGKFTGVATVDMMLDGITALLQRIGEENGGYMFAMDASGQMISFPKQVANVVKADNSMMSGKELSTQLPWLAAVMQTAATLQGQRNMALPDDGVLDGDAYVSLIRQPDTGWALGLVVPETRMTDIASSMGRFLMLAVGVLLVLVGMLAVLFFNRILAGVNQTTGQINELVEGAHSQELSVGKLNELGLLRQSVNAYGYKLKQLLEKIYEESAYLLRDAESLKHFSRDFLGKASSLSDENHTLAAATEEFGATAQDVANYAAETRSTVERIHQDVLTSGREMEAVIATMRVLTEVMTAAQNNIIKLDEDSRQAHGMLNVIRGISEQTNLLALNAAIEAARAGESGRGFAVVADEVRNLAAKSESSAIEIEQVLGRLQTASKESVASMEQGRSETDNAMGKVESTAAHLRHVVEAFGDITHQATQISVAASEQQKVSDSLSQFVSRLRELTSGNADDSSQLSSMSEQIDAIARRLNALK
ncbi:methyl-accepting chemotaxis protein [Pokkaliibacter plantistimulans]|uniref:Methyl-accepting chemotaxis protein n=1 Tax=Proteobacteria bacterium 228 TaxID=2083153 RepID=A0A2S5KW58_9PROT|nr:methyl-accepting chemotaxis protein [Pokkaliibacter plantistimulans]PPC79091.1 methyl-accepting chemotaxis protein [Pokkaliibacter plantistimulans]